MSESIEITSKTTKKSEHNKRYYNLHKKQCYRKSLIYDIRKIGRIPKKEILERYNLSLDEFIKLFATWVNNKSVPEQLTIEKKEQLCHLVVAYFELKTTCQPHDSTQHGTD